uniref:RWP-RK domain-containing protein n=1 Tax=Guillardia theta TaxID=55529 RepID=A0A7S4KX31_GUITH
MVSSDSIVSLKGLARRGTAHTIIYPRKKLGQESRKSNLVVLTFESISEMFHYPLSSVAQQLNISQTALKKACRDLGIERWPYRKSQWFKPMNGKQPDEAESGNDVAVNRSHPVKDESAVARSSHQCHCHHGSEKQVNLTLNHDPSAEDGDMDYPLHVQSNAISNLFY